MTDNSDFETSENRLHFVEFMQMCADSGYITEPTAREICRFAKYQGGVEAIPAFPGEHPDNPNRFTDLLAYVPSVECSFDNYVVTEDNSYAVELARTVALIPRIWKSISPILFHAGTGQGKTHLLASIATSSRQNTLFLNLNDLKMGYRYCIKTNKESQLLNWITSHNFLLFDDLQFVQDDIEFQHFLCSVFNRMPHGKSAIVLCSNSDVENMQHFDSTFFSRISSGVSVELKSMDLEGRITILEQMFSNTGFGPGSEIVNYIATEVTQNIRTLKAAARAVLAHLLAAPSKEVISLSTVANLLSSMNLCDHTAQNSNPSSTRTSVPDKKEEETASPYIVVDIDEEASSSEEPSDELLSKETIQASISEKVEEQEVKLTFETDEPISSQIQPEQEFERQKEVAAQPPDTGPDTHLQDVDEDVSTREESIHLFENATTVSSQIDALKSAAMRRIQQLEKKNPNSPEIAKLRFAIVFLNEGKIESAMLALK